MNPLFLVYEDQGILKVFPVVPVYMKGKRFSAKIVDEGKQRSFAFSMIYGLYDRLEDAKAVTKKATVIRGEESSLEKEYEKVEKLSSRLESLEERHSNMEERLYKKEEALENLEFKDDLTDNQKIRLQKLPLEIEDLKSKESSLYSEIEKLEGQIKYSEESLGEKEKEISQKLENFKLEQDIQFLEKAKSLEIEVREVTTKKKTAGRTKNRSLVSRILKYFR